MPLVQLTAVIEGDDLDPRALSRGVTRALQDEADETDKLYRLVYGTWDEEKPNMIKKVSTRGADAYSEVSTRGRTGEKGNRKLLWLDDGTSLRWAIMSRDWQSKTKPGQIRSGRGRGRVVARGKKATRRARRGKPGIKPGNFSDAIARERAPHFLSNVERAINDATR